MNGLRVTIYGDGNTVVSATGKVDRSIPVSGMAEVYEAIRKGTIKLLEE